MIPMLRNCCCALSLKKGTTVIGVLEVLGGIGYLIAGIILIADASAYRAKDVATALGALLLTSGALLMLSAICLLVGTMKGRSVLFLPWMGYILTFLVGITFLNVITAAQDAEMKHATSGAANAIIAVIVLILQIYFFVVVYSLYRDVRGTAPPNNP